MQKNNEIGHELENNGDVLISKDLENEKAHEKFFQLEDAVIAFSEKIKNGHIESFQEDSLVEELEKLKEKAKTLKSRVKDENLKKDIQNLKVKIGDLFLEMKIKKLTSDFEKVIERRNKELTLALKEKEVLDETYSAEWQEEKKKEEEDLWKEAEDLQPLFSKPELERLSEEEEKIKNFLNKQESLEKVLAPLKENKNKVKDLQWRIPLLENAVNEVEAFISKNKKLWDIAEVEKIEQKKDGNKILWVIHCKGEKDGKLSQKIVDNENEKLAKNLQVGEKVVLRYDQDEEGKIITLDKTNFKIDIVHKKGYETHPRFGGKMTFEIFYIAVAKMILEKHKNPVLEEVETVLRSAEKHNPDKNKLKDFFKEFFTKIKEVFEDDTNTDKEKEWTHDRYDD